MAPRMRVTHLFSGAVLAAAAALAAGCTPGSAGSASGSSQPAAAAPPVTQAEAAHVYQQRIASSLAAVSSGNEAAALAGSTDVARAEVSTAYQIQSYYKAPAPAGYIRAAAPVFYLPEPAGYPQWFVADVDMTYSFPKLPPGTRTTGGPGGMPGGIQWANADGHTVFVFKKASATAPWQLASDSKLAPGMSLPALAVGSDGRVPTVSLSDSTLLARPDSTGPLQAAVVDDGPASPAATVVASGPLTTGIYHNERAGLLELSAPRGDVLQWELEGANYDQLALRTADGGALVFYTMHLDNTVQTPASLAQARPLRPGPPISVPAGLAPLLPAGTSAPRIRLEAEQLLSFAAVDPPAGSGKIQVLAIGGVLNYASAS